MGWHWALFAFFTIRHLFIGIIKYQPMQRLLDLDTEFPYKNSGKSDNLLYRNILLIGVTANAANFTYDDSQLLSQTIQ